jgi:hypothetical protein
MSAKLLAISRPQFPLSLLGVSCVVVGVGAPGGAIGYFQSRASTISQHGCSTYGGASHRGPTEEEEIHIQKYYTKKIIYKLHLSSRVTFKSPVSQLRTASNKKSRLLATDSPTKQGFHLHSTNVNSETSNLKVK